MTNQVSEVASRKLTRDSSQIRSRVGRCLGTAVRVRCRSLSHAALVIVALCLPLPVAAVDYFHARDPGAVPTGQHEDGWLIGAGNFDGEGGDDIVGFSSITQSLHVGLHSEDTGAASFVGLETAWNFFPIGNIWKFVVGNFTAVDELSDVIGYNSSNDDLYVFRNLAGSQFGIRDYSVFTDSLPIADERHLVVGDFGGDDRDDIAVYSIDSASGTGSIYVAINSGGVYDFSLWLSVVGTDWSFAAGNFTGTAFDDLVGYRASDRKLHVATNTGSGFDSLTDWNHELSVWEFAGSESTDWRIHSGNYAPPGGGGTDYDELFAASRANGYLFVGRSTGSAFEFQGAWGRPNDLPYENWQYAAGDFDGSSDLDVVAYGWRPANFVQGAAVGRLRIFEQFTEQPAEGYAWPLSAAPGEQIDFMVSGTAKPNISFYRHRTSSDGVNLESELAPPLIPVTYTSGIQPVSEEPWANGCGWSPSFSVMIPPHWRSGIYSALLESPDEWTDKFDFHITFVVKRREVEDPTVAVLVNANTWLAYNGWGGRRKYDGAPQVSFLRPNYDVAQLDSASSRARKELWMLTWLEDNGYQPQLFTDIDFHNGEVDGSYENLVMSSHPEYFTDGEYSNLKTYLREMGGSLLYVAGNGVYERGEYVEGSNQTAMEFFGGIDNGDRLENTFRRFNHADDPETDPPEYTPEIELLGVAYDECALFTAGQPFRVTNALHPFFEDEGISPMPNETFGATGLEVFGNLNPSGAANAIEVDTIEGTRLPPGSPSPAAAEKLAECIAEYDPGSIPVAMLPGGGTIEDGGSLEVIAEGDAEPWRGGHIVYYKPVGEPPYAPGEGGHVLSIGSLTANGSIQNPSDTLMSALARNALGPVPEPTALYSLCIGVGAVAAFGRRRGASARRISSRSGAVASATDRYSAAASRS